MIEIKSGGAAFPQARSVGSVSLLEGGMTLRDYFAAKAMQGELAASAGAQQPSPGVTAEYSYRMADAMLKEREK